MLTETKFKNKKKDFKEWARNDAKSYVLDVEKNRTSCLPGEILAQKLAGFDKKKLMEIFHYSESQYEYIISWYNTNFWRGYEYWKKQIQKHSLTMLKYKDVLDRALEFGNNVDVSDLADGFPCGSCHLYLAEKHRKEDLGKALAFLNDSDSVAYKYSLNLRFENCRRQCISFSERVTKKVQKFLLENGIETYIHSWID